jgi:Domain of unknown function (DUF4432)
LSADKALAALGAITVRSERIEAVILAGKGADIYALTDLRTGVDVLFKAPWGVRTPGPWTLRGTSMEQWIEAYPGGWQLLLPNGGDECVRSGVTWGYHGEAALAEWTVLDASPASAVLETRLFSVPLHVRRELAADGQVLRIIETVTNASPAPVEVMWSHHPAFGAPFLDGSCVLSAGCRSLLADDRSPGSLLEPGSRHSWPVAGTAAGGSTDLTRVPGPDEPRSVLAYLGDFSSGYFAITNQHLRLGVALRWPLDPFGQAWLWQEMHETEQWPWYRRAYVLAVEPASTIPGQGMAAARAAGQSGVRFAPWQARQVVIEAILFEGTGQVTGIGEGCVVQFA